VTTEGVQIITFDLLTFFYTAGGGGAPNDMIFIDHMHDSNNIQFVVKNLIVNFECFLKP
jgi:hypothetical protein